MSARPVPSRVIPVVILVLMVLSGFAGLGYQIVWVRMLSLGLGHEIYAVLAVIAAFFAGLAVGAWAFDRRIARSGRPHVWFAGLELCIGLWALALILLMPLANAGLADAMGPRPSELWRWTVAFGGPFLLLLPATAAMGATLPAAERVYARLCNDLRSFSGLYAANTFGAVLGVVVSAYWLLPAIGYSAALWLFALANGLGALGMYVLGRGPAAPAERVAAVEAEPAAWIRPVLFTTGFLGIGIEVAAVRALSQLLENTVYSFASALAVYLLATALGAALYARWQRRGAREFTAGAAMLALATGIAAALGTLAVHAVPQVYAALRGVSPSGTSGAMLAEFGCAVLVLGLPALTMGGLFAHLAGAMRGHRGGLGVALAANTLGAALAPLAIGTVLVPWIGVMNTLSALALGYAVIAEVLSPNRRVLAGAGIAAAVSLVGIAGPFNRTLVEVPPNGRLLAHVEGVSTTASVVETDSGTRFLRVNGRFTMGGTASYRLDRLQAHAALMQQVAPKRALFLGIGTGATVAAAVDHPDLQIDAVDLSPEVLALIPQFAEVEADLQRAGERIRLGVADARRAVRTAEGGYDLILADTYHPARDGAGLLYTQEHFSAIRDKLADDGTFVQWLPLHQLDLPTLRVIARTYLEVFPDARLFMGNFNLGTPLLALYGRRDGKLPVLNAIATREVPLPLRSALDRVGLQTPFALLGGFIAGPEALRDWAGPGPLNRDDLPVVLFEAPDSVYAPLGPPIDRLLALVGAMHGTPSEAIDLIGIPQSAGMAERLGQYWQARDMFLQLGTRTSVTGDLARDIATLAPQLIDILRVSPDFAPAYDPLISMARAVAQQDVRIARTLLLALRRAVPHRPEATAMLARLPG